MLIHRPSLGPVKPVFRVMPEFHQSLAAEIERPTPVLPSFEQVQRLGNLRTAMPVSEVRDYADITSRVLKHVKWSDDEFDVHRVVVPYPMINTIVGMWFELPGES